MATIFNNNESFNVDSGNLVSNSLCYTENNFNEESKSIFYILLVCFAVGGLGDIIFGIKFAQYILNSFPSIHITLLTGDRNDISQQAQQNKINFVQKALNAYVNRVTVVGSLSLSPAFLDCPREFKIMYVVPAVGNNIKISLTGNYAGASYNRLYYNSYNFSEYNTPSKTNSETGVPNGNGQLGLLLSTDDKLLPAPPLLNTVINNRPFSLAYFYMDEATVFKAHVKGQKEYESQDEYNVRAKNELYKAHYELSTCFLHYFNLLKNYSRSYNSLYENQSPSGIAILCKHGMIDNLVNFIEKYLYPDAQNVNELKKLGEILRAKVYKENGKMLIEMIDYCRMDSKEMFALYQRSLPTVFISGDQSITDFISVNQYPDQDIFYQIMGWKMNLAQALGIKEITNACGKIPKGVLINLKNNPNADFRLRGLRLVENTLNFALKHGGDVEGRCTYYKHSDQLGTQVYSDLVIKLKSYEIDFLYSILDTGQGTVKLTQKNNNFMDFKPKQNLHHTQNEMYLDWLRGSNSSKGSIYVRVFPYVLNGDSQPVNIGIPVGDHNNPGCKSILSRAEQKINTLSNTYFAVTRSVAAIGMASIVNQLIRRNSILKKHLTYTYASLDTRCLNVKSLLPGMVLFSERAPTSMSLKEFLNNPDIYDVGALSSVLLQLFWIIYKLQWEGEVVHNGFQLESSILVEPLNSPRVIDLDNIPTDVGSDIWSGGFEEKVGTIDMKLPVKFLVRIQDFSNSRFTIEQTIFSSVADDTSDTAHNYSPLKLLQSRDHDKNVFMETYKEVFNGKALTYSLPYLLIQLSIFYGNTLVQKPKLSRYPSTDFSNLFNGDEVLHVVE